MRKATVDELFIKEVEIIEKNNNMLDTTNYFNVDELE
jgi:hypothetical protein